MDCMNAVIFVITATTMSVSAKIDPDRISKSYNLQGSGRFSLTETMKIPVVSLNNLYLETKYCGNFSLFLFSSYNRKSDGEIRVDITAKAVAITFCPNIQSFNTCIIHTTVQKNVPALACGKLSHLWLSWNSQGHVTFGQGQTSGQAVLLDHDAAVPYPIRYMTFQKPSKEQCLFTFKYDLGQALPDSLILQVPENTSNGKALHTFSPAWNCIKGSWSAYLGSIRTTLVASPYKNHILLLKRLDYEKRRIHTMHFRCMRETTYVNLTVTIHVLDSNDNFPVLTKVGGFSVTEELPPGTPLAPWIRANDRDQGDTLSYTLTGQDGNFFNIDKSTGVVSVARRIDRETTSVLYLGIEVKDAAGHGVSANLTIRVLDINDNQPKFQKELHRLDLSYNHRAKILTTFNLSDADDGDGKCNCKLKITAGNDQNIFVIVGNQFYAKLQKLMDLNILQTQGWQLLVTVTASDRPVKGTALSSSAFVFITVEKPPKYLTFPKIIYKFTTVEDPKMLHEESITVPETISVPHKVVYRANSAKADAKSLASGYQQYHLRSDIDCTDGMGADDYFKIDPKTGDVTLRRHLDADANGCTKYKMSFYLSDFRELTRIYFSVLTVTVTEVNDITPVATPFYVKTRLPCHPYPRHHVAKFHLKDDDKGKTNFRVTVASETTLKYEIIPTGHGVNIAIDKNEKPWTKSFRYDVIKLKIEDGGKPQLSSMAYVAVESSKCSRRKRREAESIRIYRSGTKGQNPKSSANYDVSNGSTQDDAGLTISYKSGSTPFDETQTAYVDLRSLDEVDAKDHPGSNSITGSNAVVLTLLSVLLTASVVVNIVLLSVKKPSNGKD